MRENMKEKLAIYGGPKAKPTKNYPMYPGGLEIGEEERKLVNEVIDKKYLFRYYGPEKYLSMVKQFEEEFKNKVGAKYALAVNSCTSALITALVACGVGPVHEVIVPGYTFFASCASILAAKAIPIIAEIDETLTMDPDDISNSSSSPYSIPNTRLNMATAHTTHRTIFQMGVLKVKNLANFWLYGCGKHHL